MFGWLLDRRTILVVDDADDGLVRAVAQRSARQISLGLDYGVAMEHLIDGWLAGCVVPKHLKMMAAELAPCSDLDLQGGSVYLRRGRRQQGGQDPNPYALDSSSRTCGSTTTCRGWASSTPDG